MKKFLLFCLCAGAITGCSTYEGGTTTDYQTGRGYSAYPEPMASPTFSPGMNPGDIRDSTSVTRPGEYQSGPANPQWGLPR